MNILVINQPLNNRGDESAHKALIRNLCERLPECKINVLFVKANSNSVHQFNINKENVKYINLKSIKGFNKITYIGLKYNLPLLWYLHPTIKEVINIYKKNDYILCAPGGICMGGFQNWTHLFYLKLAKYLHKPLIYYGRSFGPFPTDTKNNRRFKRISLEMLNYFSFLSIRDTKTENLAKQFNLRYNSTVDTAFLDSPKTQIPIEIQKLIKTNKYMVFVPNLLIWHYKYKNKLTKETVLNFYKEIISIITINYPDLNIIFLPQTFNYGNYLGDDKYFFLDLAKEIDDPRLIVIDDIYGSDIQQTIIANSEFLIGARYHSVVFAINNNVPFIALSYEHKISGLIHKLNKDDRLVDITQLENGNNDKLLDQIKILVKNLEKDKKAQNLAKTIANDCFNKLVVYLSKSGE